MDSRSRRYRLLTDSAAPLLVALLLLVSRLSYSQLTSVHLQQSFPVLQIENQIWIGTPVGLYRYDRTDDSFTKFVIPSKNTSPSVRLLYTYKQWLWCVLDTGLAALQIPLNDWLVFDSTNGLPSSSVTGLDFQGDYVWVSTQRGFARFDLLIEQWELFDERRGLPDRHVADIVSDRQAVWLITGKGFSEYNPQFEKWRHFTATEDSTVHVKRLFFLEEELWIVTQRGLIRFNPKLQRTQFFFLPYLSSENLIEAYIEGSKLWAITRQGIYIYDKPSGVWKDFDGNSALSHEEIAYGMVNASQVWVLVKGKALVWDRAQKTWEFLDYSSGLSSTEYTAVSTDGDLTFLFTSNGTEYRKAQRDPWRRLSFEASRTSTAGVFSQLLDNPEGGSLSLGPYVWGWQGTRITSLHEFSQRISENATTSQSHEAGRFDVKSQLGLGEGRRVTGFYNNIDYTEAKYGSRLRGNESDLVRELTWGDFRREAGENPFARPAEVFGANLWLQHGPKTERYKRSLLTVKGTNGEIRSQRTYELIQGTSERFTRHVRDSDYVRARFFGLPGIDSSTVPEEVQIYVDDHLSATNLPGTSMGSTIAGILGDFDPWVPTEEFYYYRQGHAVRMLKPIIEGWTVVARWIHGGRYFEAVLQDRSATTTELDNFYSLGAQQILPYSFKLQLTDSTGVTIPPSSFGLDRDGDGRVDPQWIDYDNGLLFFPTAQPFPPQVYDPTSGISVYKLQCEGETQLAIAQLKHQNLVRGSETLTLDGAFAIAGNDYVLDYTNGTLVFVREGLVGPDTRIEVEYEYYTAAGARLTSVGLNFSPSDQFYAQTDVQHLSNDSTLLIDLNGEIRHSAGEFDVRLLPGVLYQTRERELAGKSLETFVSSPWLRIQTRYEDYARAYKNLYRSQSVFGDVKNRFSFSTTVDISRDLRFAGSWKDARGVLSDGSAESPYDRTGDLSLLLHSQDLPSARLTYQTGETGVQDSVAKKEFVQALLEYQVPQSWSRLLFVEGVKLEYYLKLGKQTGRSDLGIGKQRFNQTYYRVNALLTEQFQVGFFYRSNDLYDVTFPAQHDPITGSDRLLADVSFTEWQIVQVNARVENSLQQEFHRENTLNNYYLRQFRQTNVRLLPGYIWAALSPLFFELTYNEAVLQSGVIRGQAGSYLWRLSAPDQTPAGSFVVDRNTVAKNEFRPNSDWLFTTLVEWNKQEINAGVSRMDKHSWQFTEKADVRLTFATRFVAQYRRLYQDRGANRTSVQHEPSIWLEHRWTQDVLTTAQLLYRRNETNGAASSLLMHDWESILDVALWKDQWLGMRHVEVRQSLSGTYRRSNGIPIDKNYQVGTSSTLNLYPLHSLTLRLRMDWNRYGDLVVPQSTYNTWSFSLKLTLQL